MGNLEKQSIRITTCLFGLMAVVACVRGQVPEQYRGDWLLVNGAVALRVDADGTMMLRNTGEIGKLNLKKDGAFTWEIKPNSRRGKLSDGKLFLKNDQEDAPKWMEYLEFRKGETEVAKELIQFAERQQKQLANARRKRIEIMILNNLRMLDGAAIQFCLENNVKTVKLDQIVGPKKLIEKLTPVDGEDYSKLDLTEGVTPWKVVSASGVTVTFDHR